MPAPSQLTIATSSVLRLLKEDVSYRKEAVDQEAQIKILEEKIKAGEGLADETNDEFMLKQQVGSSSSNSNVISKHTFPNFYLSALKTV